MEKLEQKAIYDEMHKMELRLMKDNEDKRNDVIEKIHSLAIMVKAHNGVRDIVEKNSDGIVCNKTGINGLFNILNKLEGIKDGVIITKKRNVSTFNVVTGVFMALMALGMLAMAFCIR